MQYKDANSLISAVGYGKIQASDVMHHLFPPDSDSAGETAKGISTIVRRVLRRTEKKVHVKVKGMDGLLIYLAKCCNPIPGEKIFGYITRGRGISVHSESCSNEELLKSDPERIIEVSWEAPREILHPVKVSIHVEDRQGILASIINNISDNKTNIMNVEARTPEGSRGHISLMLQITDIEHLNRILTNLKSIDGVIEVERIMNQQR